MSRYFIYAFKGDRLYANYVFGKSAGYASGLRNAGWTVYMRKAA